MARKIRSEALRGAVSGDGTKGFLRGEVKIVPLATVKPNPWNPNKMTAHMKKAMYAGLISDGWLVSQALLVWGTDDKGTTRNLIIDGEHRFLTAKETGLTEGPMVFLDGLTETQAKKLTIKMNQKRGDFAEAQLTELLRSIQKDEGGLDDGDTDLSLALGFDDEELMKLLAEPAGSLPIVPPVSGEPSGAGTGLPQSKIRMQQLFFDEAGHEEFTRLVRELAAKYGTKNVTDTTLEAVRRAAAAATKGERRAAGSASVQS